MGAAAAKSKRVILHNPLDAMELVTTDACRMTGQIFGAFKARLAHLNSCFLLFSLSI